MWFTSDLICAHCIISGNSNDPSVWSALSIYQVTRRNNYMAPTWTNIIKYERIPLFASKWFQLGLQTDSVTYLSSNIGTENTVPSGQSITNLMVQIHKSVAVINRKIVLHLQVIYQLPDNKTQKEGSGTYANHLKSISYAKEHTEWYIQYNNQITKRWREISIEKKL